MASVLKRLGPKGRTVYQAQVRKKGYPYQIKTFDRKLDAQNWARKIEHEMDSGQWKDTKDAAQTTMNEAIDRYLKNVTIRKRDNTQHSEKLSARYLKQELGKYSFLQVTPEKVSIYRDTRLKSVSANSVRIELALLSCIFTIAQKEWAFNGLDNPVKKVSKPKLPEGRCPILSKEQISHLLRECKNSQTRLLYPFVLLALHTGCRSMELRGLRWSQINLKEGYIALVGDETKGQKSRTIPLTDAAMEILKNLADPQNVNKGLGLNENPVGLVFPARFNLMEPRDMHMSFNRAVRRAGLDQLPGVGKLRIHDLRHLCGSFLVMNGVDLETIRSILGHRDLSTTQRYLHVINQHKKNAIDKIGHLGISNKNVD